MTQSVRQHYEFNFTKACMPKVHLHTEMINNRFWTRSALIFEDVKFELHGLPNVQIQATKQIVNTSHTNW